MLSRKSVSRKFASSIYHGRIVFHLTQQQVADYLGRSKRWYQKIEAGFASPSLPDVIGLMALFDIDAKDVARAAGMEMPALKQ